MTRWIALLTLTAFAGMAAPRPAWAAQRARVYYYHPDHLGSTNLVTDESGQVVQRVEYMPFGQPGLQEGQAVTDRKFTGKQLDASTGLYYYGARYYDPELGRFIQPDTLVPDPGDPQDLNRYSYAGNNPINFTDPTGHFKFSKFLKSLFVGAFTAAIAIIAAPLAGPIIAGTLAGAAGGAIGGTVHQTSIGKGALTGGGFGFATAAAGVGITDAFGNTGRQIYDASVVLGAGITAGIQGGADGFLGGVAGSGLVTGFASGFSYGTSSAGSPQQARGFWDTLLDVGMFISSLQEYRENPGFWTGLGLFADGLALLAPGVPAGGGLAAKSLGATDKARNANRAYRYVGPDEAAKIRRTGHVPNLSVDNKPKPIFVTFDSPMNSGPAARSTYGLPTTPTHRVTVDTTGVKFDYAGNVQQGSLATEGTTRRSLRVLGIDRLGE